MKTLLIDNYDSFTYNLYQQLMRLGTDVCVKKHDEISADYAGLFDRIVISPGPKTPLESGICLDVIRAHAGEIPILGVCLGHQCIAHVFGAGVGRAREVVHGKTSRIFHDGEGIFRLVSSPFSAARYHSLVVESVPKGFKLSAHTSDDVIMAISNESKHLYGVQFHPESFMTAEGDKIINNFLSCVG